VSELSKRKVSVICGGSSEEHAVSIQSGQYIAGSFDLDRYEVTVVIVDHDLDWYLVKDTDNFCKNGFSFEDKESYHCIIPAVGLRDTAWITIDDTTRWNADIIFPIIHGTLGEDGSLQGLLHWLKIPFVGSDVYASALCMDKWAAKKALEAAGIATTPWAVVSRDQWPDMDMSAMQEQFSGFPMFVKPTDLGSSIGVTKAYDEDTLSDGIFNALRFSKNALIEKAIIGREIECGVMGAQNPVASLPGELIVHAEFYDYHAKYENPEGATLEIPAKLSQDLTVKIQRAAEIAYKVLRCEGMARVDFFLMDDGTLYLNEVNTLPGFTAISMFPKMWAGMGLDRYAMVEQLLALAIDRYNDEFCKRYRPEDRELMKMPRIPVND
jgi:D-alanine-D-alanine ligase